MSRVRRSPDAGRMAALVSRPGIDTRVWLTLALVKLVHVDLKRGVLVDLTLLPAGAPETAYLGVPYAGAAFGDHCPVEVDDTVLVAIPGGDPNQGPVIISRWHSGGDPPHPELVGTEEKSRVIRAKPGERVVIRTSEVGVVSVVAEGPGDVEVTSLGGLVQLGAEVPGLPAKDFVALATPLLSVIDALQEFAKALGTAPPAPPNGALTTVAAAAAATALSTALTPLLAALPTTRVRAT